jgi:glycosyltransferase involved in cell wall biosynthesis
MLKVSRILLFDPYISLYDTMVHDRKLIKATSWKAMYYFLLDKYSCELADICLLDTHADVKYFSETFKIPYRKFRRVFVGADDDIFHPIQTEQTGNNFVVFWYGTYIPLHGAEYIVKAAKILEKYQDIRFIMVGQGQTYPYVRKLAEMLRISNIEFVSWIRYKDLPVHMSKADVCLGIFGETGKARRVIPNKVFQALAMEKPVITANTPAAREALTHLENVYLCDAANPKSIADGILTLKEDEKLRKKLAKNGYQLFKEKFSVKQIGKNVKEILEDALS